MLTKKAIRKYYKEQKLRSTSSGPKGARLIEPAGQLSGCLQGNQCLQRLRTDQVSHYSDLENERKIRYFWDIWCFSRKGLNCNFNWKSVFVTERRSTAGNVRNRCISVGTHYPFTFTLNPLQI